MDGRIITKLKPCSKPLRERELRAPKTSSWARCCRAQKGCCDCGRRLQGGEPNLGDESAERYGADAEATEDPDVVRRAGEDCAAPGWGMLRRQCLEERGLKQAMEERIAQGTPFLGIWWDCSGSFGKRGGSGRLRAGCVRCEKFCNRFAARGRRFRMWGGIRCRCGKIRGCLSVAWRQVVLSIPHTRTARQ